MSLSIVNNAAALSAEANLARTNEALSRSLGRLSTGVKIEQARPSTANIPAGLIPGSGSLSLSRPQERNVQAEAEASLDDILAARQSLLEGLSPATRHAGDVEGFAKAVIARSDVGHMVQDLRAPPAHLANPLAAPSMARENDFALEVANFTRQQVQMQAGATVLGNANQITQLVASLLRG